MGIHVLATGTGDADNRVDARVKPAHDDLQLVPIKTQHPVPVPQTALRASGNPGTPRLKRSLFKQGQALDPRFRVAFAGVTVTDWQHSRHFRSVT